MAETDNDLVEILDENIPIDLVKYINHVKAPQAGIIATFSDTTRDTFDGKTVLELRYEAYVPMEVRCLKTICSSARSSWNLHSITVAHCLGAVPVRETSVFIAVSSVHHEDGLDACKFLIDELKASLPIWKKEVYTNGEVWKENLDFMDRRMELGKSDGGCCRRKENVEVQTRKSCCESKVKGNDGDSQTSDSYSELKVPLYFYCSF